MNHADAIRILKDYEKLCEEVERVLKKDQKDTEDYKIYLELKEMNQKLIDVEAYFDQLHKSMYRYTF